MTPKQFDNKLSGSSFKLQPLYKQVEEHVIQLIVEQHWKPGEMLPSEFELASQYNVSQGTVRKALNSLTDSKILTRRQGVGTFVSEHTGHQALYRFFPLVADGEKPELPKAEVMQLRLLKSVSTEILNSLGLKAKEKVIFLSRRRILNGEYCLLEDIHLPYKYFKELLDEEEIPHTLYHFYQTRFNLTVHKTVDKIKAVLARASDAKALEIDRGEPLLKFTRVTYSLDGKIIEYRVNRCRSDRFHYLVDLE
ncbi:GntR family transcriptional regulator [Agarilytica rhodophyticola]|uniref:GntR family transcriptional regulator n=1 Tax=Agarilytica rhodophyticola TaxID=1737490 RepID=UPI000B347541|nr:GntR family transcriptional regulator [Agarilytica rhodophyticola]